MRSGAVGLSLVVLLAVASSARADPLTKAHELRLSGEAATWTGVALYATGLALLIAGLTLPSCAFVLGAPESGSCAGGAPPNAQQANSGVANGLFVAGVALTGVATAVLAIGIPAWSLGAHREKKLRAAVSFATGTFSF
jgi:hypothetical protein